MTGCNVCIGGGDYDETYSFSDERIMKARKDHICYECRRPILKGTLYHYFTGLFERCFDRYRTCMDCHNVRTGLTCDGGAWPPFGELWNDIQENFPYLKSTACLIKIPTASAKAYFLERWRQWKFREKD